MRLRSFLMLFGMLCRHCVSVPHVLSAFLLSFGVIFVGDLGWLPLRFTTARENNSLWCLGLVRGVRNFVDCARHLNAY